MRRLFMLSALLLAGNAAAISFDDARQQPVEPPAGQAVTQKVPAKTGDNRQPVKPAATFNPTEKIGADSAVSFPVDSADSAVSFPVDI